VKIQIGRIDSDLEVARKEQRRGFNRRLSQIPADYLKKEERRLFTTEKERAERR
jgi:hypothetical protein